MKHFSCYKLIVIKNVYPFSSAVLSIDVYPLHCHTTLYSLTSCISVYAAKTRSNIKAELDIRKLYPTEANS